jgi:7 transmembrane receptor (rhodopsin family)
VTLSSSSHQDKLVAFYVAVFTFIFFPIFLAFIWLNGVIASEIWKRRHAPGVQIQSKMKKADDDPSTLEMKATDETNTSSNARNNSSKTSFKEPNPSAESTKQPVFTIQPALQAHIDVRRKENQRQRRQMRMFKVILILIFTFIACRLPNWIFLLYKLKNKVSQRLNWLLLYSFAALGLLNCMLNPMLYSFLGETIRITTRIGNACYRFCKLCRPQKTSTRFSSNQIQISRNERPRRSDGGIYLGS